MSKRRTEQSRRRAAKRTARVLTQHAPSGNSNYGRKRAFLITRGGMGIDYPHKPWRSA